MLSRLKKLLGFKPVILKPKVTPTRGRLAPGSSDGITGVKKGHTATLVGITVIRADGTVEDYEVDK